MIDTLEHERQILGIALVQPEKLATIDLPAAAFSDATNRQVYVCLIDLFYNGGTITTQAIASACEGVDHGYLKRLLIEAEPTGVIGYHAAEIAKAFRQRQAESVIRSMVDGLQAGRDPLELLQECSGVVDTLGGDDSGFDPIDIDALIDDHPTLAEPIVEGLLRRGETANFVAAPKIGKSWLVYDLCFSIATGGLFLGRFRCRQGRVLLIDNELDKRNLASRLRTVRAALGIQKHETSGRFTAKALRGDLRDLNGIANWLGKVKPGQYDLIVLDAFYRALPGGVSENANEGITSLFNLIDKMTRRLDCAWVNIHHSSKGEQGGKAVTDVGAGAGAQSRAADTHIVLRGHQQEGVIVLDAVCRSFAPVEPLALRWEFPCFTPDADADPAALLGKMTPQQRQQVERDTTAIADILQKLQAGPLTARAIRNQTGLGKDRCDRLLHQLETSGEITGEAVIVRGNDCREFRLAVDVVGSDVPRDQTTRPRGGDVGWYGPLKGNRPRPRTPLEASTGLKDQTTDHVPRPKGTADDPIVFGESA